jgi:OOP family OmpA-OmpF porin
MLQAFLEGGNQVITYPQALDRAAEVSQEINQESGADADYWKRYYLGVEQKDKAGKLVSLGGSKASNLADNLTLFGLAPGMSPKTSRMRATFTVFGNISHTMYPKLVTTEAIIDSVVDASYLKNIAASSEDDETEVTPEVTYTKRDTLSHVVGKRAVSITFATGLRIIDSTRRSAA